MGGVWLFGLRGWMDEVRGISSGALVSFVSLVGGVAICDLATQPTSSAAFPLRKTVRRDLSKLSRRRDSMTLLTGPFISAGHCATSGHLT